MEMLGRRSGRGTQGSCASGKPAIEIKHGVSQDQIGSLPMFLAPAIVFLVSFSVYVRCLHPGAAPADSSELAAAAHTLGAAHPPGYPLFCITYKIASLLIPFFGVAWRMNIFNALLTAAAAAAISCTSLRLSRSLPAAVLSGLLYALCETGWHFALHAEVFALNSLTTAIAMYLLLRYMQHPSQLWCVLGAHAFCVGLANQHTIVLLLPPVAAGVLMRDASVCLAWSTIRHCVFAAVIGASFYIYLPIATGNSPHVSWGDSNSLAGFKRHVLREEYGTFKLTADHGIDGRLMEGLYHFGLRLHQEWTLLPALLVPGVLSLCRQRGAARWFASTCAACVVFYLVVFHYMANIELHGKPDQQNIVRRFWLMPFIILSPIIGHGFHVSMSKFSLNTWALLSLVLALAAAWVSFALPRLDQSANDFTSQLGRAFLDPLPHGALLLLMADTATNSVRFVQAVEGYRPDVLVLDQNIMSTEWFKGKHAHHFPNVTFPGALFWPSREDGYNMQEFLRHNIPKFRIFVFPFFKEPSPLSAYALVPHGYCQEIVACGSKGNCDAPSMKFVKMWGASAAKHLPKPLSVWQQPALKYPNWMWEGFHRTYHADSIMRYAKFMLDHRQSIPGAAQLAAKWYEDLLALDDGPSSDPSVIDDNRLLSKSHVMQLRRNMGVACYFVAADGDSAYKDCASRELSIYLKFLQSEPSSEANEADRQQMEGILQGLKQSK